MINEDDTKVICRKAISLEILMLDVNINNAFQIHSDYKYCIESDCKGWNMECDYYKSIYLGKKLS